MYTISEHIHVPERAAPLYPLPVVLRYNNGKLMYYFLVVMLKIVMWLTICCSYNCSNKRVC